MKRIVLITGGQSSGKSLHAERLALEATRIETGTAAACGPVYVATARNSGDMASRIERHRARRGPEWTLVEEPAKLGRLAFPGRVVMIDCVTLWLTNLMLDASEPGCDAAHSEVDVSALEAAAVADFERFTAPVATYIFVTGEVGLGGVAANRLARDFADLQGRVNQHIASRADEVILVVSGIPVKIK